VEEAFNRLTKWIPGETLTFYAAAVTAVSAKEDAQPSIALLIVFAVVTLALVIGGEFAKTGDVQPNSWVPAGLSVLAFLIWSITIPSSGWQRWDLVQDNQALVTLMAALIAVIFCLFAEGIKKRLERKASRT